MYKWRDLKDKLFVASIILAAFTALTPLFHLIVVVVSNGLRVLASAGASFFTDIPPTPLSATLGGIAPALVGSFTIVAISLPITVLIGLLSAVLAEEFPGNVLSRAVDMLSRSMACLPTIMVSMVVYVTVVVPMRQFSALAGSIALSLISLPYAYTSFSSALRSVPSTYREAAYAIGMNRWRTVFSVLVRIARRGVVAGILLSLARAMGETAALLFTVGRYRAGVRLDLFSPTDALPLLIFDFITSPFRVYQELAWGASLVLLVVYILTFIVAKFVVREVKL